MNYTYSIENDNNRHYHILKFKGNVVSKGVRKQCCADYLRRREICNSAKEATHFLNKSLIQSQKVEFQITKAKLENKEETLDPIQEETQSSKIEALEKRLSILETFHENQKREAVAQLEKLLSKIREPEEEPLE